MWATFKTLLPFADEVPAQRSETGAPTFKTLMTFHCTDCFKVIHILAITPVHLVESKSNKQGKLVNQWRTEWTNSRSTLKASFPVKALIPPRLRYRRSGTCEWLMVETSHMNAQFQNSHQPHSWVHSQSMAIGSSRPVVESLQRISLRFPQAYFQARVFGSSYLL